MKEQPCLSASPSSEHNCRAGNPQHHFFITIPLLKNAKQNLSVNEPCLNSFTYENLRNNGLNSFLTNLHFQCLPKSCSIHCQVSQLCHFYFYSCDYSQFSPFLMPTLRHTPSIQSRHIHPSKLPQVSSYSKVLINFFIH